MESILNSAHTQQQQPIQSSSMFPGSQQPLQTSKQSKPNKQRLSMSGFMGLGDSGKNNGRNSSQASK
jgi:hypothetical protein